MVFLHSLLCERYETYLQPPWHTTASYSTLETQSKFDWYRPWKRQGSPGLIFGGLPSQFLCSLFFLEYFSCASSSRLQSWFVHQAKSREPPNSGLFPLSLHCTLASPRFEWAAGSDSGMTDRCRSPFPTHRSKNISHMSQWANCGGRRRGRILIVRTSQHLDRALSKRFANFPEGLSNRQMVQYITILYICVE